MSTTGSRLADNRGVILATCFIEGLSVLVVEIAGTRALAPYYGASLVVWTSQITATLLFLALGYHFGGRLSRRWKPIYLPLLFWGAGLWLCLFPILRSPVLQWTSDHFGLAGGSLAAAIALFGIPLGCFGAVSPVLIEHWNRRNQGAGNAAGTVFFVNTIGGLVGAWLTALVLIPGYSMRMSMLATGLLVAAVGMFWFFLFPHRSKAAPAAVALLCLVMGGVSPSPVRSFSISGGSVNVIHSRQGWVGLVQVLESTSMNWRTLIIDGITQGGVDTRYGYSQYEFTEYMNVLGHRYHPRAKRALLLGLGSGVLARQLIARGLEVEALELDPVILQAAKTYFGLPAGVKVHLGDAREALGKVQGKFDLVFLDAFAGESVPWHLVTQEGLVEIRSKMNADGRLLVNTVTDAKVGSPGLERMEASLLDGFEQVRVFVEPANQSGHTLVNALLVAGKDLVPQDQKFPGDINPLFWEKIENLYSHERGAVKGAPVGLDDHSDLDYADRNLRANWRKLVMSFMDVNVLED